MRIKSERNRRNKRRCGLCGHEAIARALYFVLRAYERGTASALVSLACECRSIDRSFCSVLPEPSTRVAQFPPIKISYQHVTPDLAGNRPNVMTGFTHGEKLSVLVSLNSYSYIKPAATCPRIGCYEPFLLFSTIETEQTPQQTYKSLAGKYVIYAEHSAGPCAHCAAAAAPCLPDIHAKLPPTSTQKAQQRILQLPHCISDDPPWLCAIILPRGRDPAAVCDERNGSPQATRGRSHLWRHAGGDQHSFQPRDERGWRNASI